MAQTFVIRPSVAIRWAPALGFWRLVARKAAGQAMSEEINAVARKARTQIRRKLADQTKIPYGEVSQKVFLVPAHAGRLEARIRVRSNVPTLGRFMTSYTRRPISWRKRGWRQTMRLRVWEGSKRFPLSGTKKPFVIEGKRLIAVRTGRARLPIKVLSGPHLANETLRDGKATGQYVKVEMPHDFQQRVIKRIQRILAGTAA